MEGWLGLNNLAKHFAHTPVFRSLFRLYIASIMDRCGEVDVEPYPQKCSQLIAEPGDRGEDVLLQGLSEATLCCFEQKKKNTLILFLTVSSQ